MRILLPFLLLIVNAQIGFGQSLRIGLLGQPCFTYYSTITDNATAVQSFKQQYKPLVTYQLGVVFYRQISSNVSFMSGLIFAQRGFQSQFNTSNINAFGFSSKGYEWRIIDRYLEVPLGFLFYLNASGSIRWCGQVGLKPAFYINSISKSTISGTSSLFYYSAHRKVNVFVTLGFGAEITLTDRLGLFVVPQLEHALIPEVYAAPLRLYPYSLGLNLCLAYSLGN